MPEQKTVEQHIAEREERQRRNREARQRRRAKVKQAPKPAASETGDADQAPAKEHGPGKPRVRQGIVKSAKPDKTIIVRIDSARRHRMYKKIVHSSTTIHAHDENNDAGEGDRVRVVETRPLSRTKRWRLVEITERAR